MSKAKKIICFVLLGSGLVAAVLHRGGESDSKTLAFGGGSSPTVQGHLPGQDGTRTPPWGRKFEPSVGNKEVWNFLKGSIIRKLELKGLTVAEALEILNQALQEMPSAGKRPAIKATPDLLVDPRRIRELRGHDVPASVALKYICDQSRCKVWVYKGNVFVDAYHADSQESDELFLKQAKLVDLAVPTGNLVEALEALEGAIEEADFYGMKLPPGIHDEELRAAIARGEVGKPIHGMNLRNVTVEKALHEICRQAGARYDFFEGEIHVVPKEWKATAD